jgi:predicted GTPase
MEKMNARLHTNSAIVERDSEELGKWLKHTADQMRHRGDVQHAEKMLELAKKWQEAIVMVTFCGHFSAGKSSVINALCGKQLLPSSPIPTSANVVTLRYGERHARVLRRSEQDGTVLEEPVQFEQLDDVCRNGAGIERVVLFDEIDWMKQGVALLDTPGVDSTDAAHRAATEEAMHLADIVFYVTDYNHVQSETNFAFAKEVVDAGKPLIWIVNQIDKHREQELTFESYQSDVRSALDAWQLKPEGVFYISVRQPEHPLNEWNALEAYVRQTARERLPLVRYGILRAARELVSAHAKVLKEPFVSKREQLVERIGDEASLAAWKEQLHLTEQRIAELTAREQEVNASFQKQVQQLLSNANVTPAVMREQAQRYLESRKPGFKVGFLFSSAKTDNERTQRLQSFTSIWKEGLRANVEVHLIQMIRSLAEEVGANEQEASAAMEQSMPDLGDSWLADSVSEGASGSPEYTLNYCKSIADEARAMLRRAALTVAEPLLEIKLRQYREELTRAESELASMSELSLEFSEVENRLQATTVIESELVQAIQLWLPADKLECGWIGLLPDIHSLKQVANSKEKVVGQHAAQARNHERVHNAPAGSDIIDHVQQRRSDKQAIVESWLELSTEADGLGTSGNTDRHVQGQSFAKDSERNLTDHGSAPNGTEQRSEAAAPSQVRRKLIHTAQKLEQAAGVLERLESMQMLAAEMREKAKRLDENRFTVALFGAFSAGKSSFANALIGQDALPVSPNPTTAAINTIEAATDEHPHGTARVTMKREAKLLDDLRYALETLGEPNAPSMDMDEVLHALARIRPETIHPSGRPYYRFIQAVDRGIDETRGLLGQELMVDEAQYRLFVSDESRSAFVERIDLFIDSELTRQGFVFVDTPGADSINARHTGVAFEYMKQADIILFVTYYNHAFSQADRQFLTQLGRVKDAFELDKMFFVVNASDLAASPEELSSVLDYVEDRLREFGVRSPRLFPISSLQALEGKQQAQKDKIRTSGIGEFEQSFLEFAGNELTQLSIHSAHNSLDRAARQLKAMWDASHADAAEREREVIRYQALAEQARRSCTEWLERDESSLFQQEADELLYHVGQRLQFRFGDMFSHAFNPASLRRDDRDIDSALQRCYVEWIRLFSKELANELYATSLRMEQGAKKLVISYHDRLQLSIMEQLPGYSPADVDMGAWPTPEVSGELDLPNVTTRWIRGYFRNSKTFFEGSGRSELRQALELQAMQAVKRVTEAHREQFIEHILTHYNKVIQKSYKELSDALDLYMERLNNALHANVDEELLQAVMSTLEEVITTDS